MDATVVLPFRTVDALLHPERGLAAGLHVVRDADEWARHWAGPPPGRPFAPAPIDWQREMCVAVPSHPAPAQLFTRVASEDC
ncbi:hypothetical protein ACTI_73420 [Actinoplanes sp. OR16]|uniref:hypothetical protein n=1 Tax=Actinoplanes sp. OR16 TaxID=946334 RepID=UPI000F71FEE3|nr:hypothetical protein [Actinoplanes sp. OR16]BBH70657.1 hypothetical protein ACTI_73420 [Actinoplanes sp. OR16]